MREWRAILGPFLVWTAHFVLVYGLASIADIRPAAESGVWRTLGLALSLGCVVAIAGGAVWHRTRTGPSPLAKRLSLFGSGIGIIAVTWQTLPLLISGGPL